MSGGTDWTGGGTTRAPIEPKICLLRFFDSVNCWELNYSKQSPANRWILHPLHWISAAALWSGKQAQALRSEPDLNIDGCSPIVKGRLVLRFTETHGFFIKMSLLQNRAFATGCLWHMPSIVFLVDGECHHI